MQGLKDVEADLSRTGVTLGTAPASNLVHHDLKRGHFLEPLGGEHLYTTVDAAIAALQPPKS